MQPIIWDTSIYITKLREKFDWDISEKTQNIILSSVAVAELATGYALRSEKYISFENYVNHMLSTDRILTPSFLNWYDAGIIIGRIIRSRPDLKNKKALLFNDCLIAISSTQINAKVITSNIKDFELIKRYVNFDVSYQSC